MNSLPKKGDSAMLTTFKANAKKLPNGLQVETNARGFKILMDEPEELGGTNAGMNPVEAILCALGACQTIVASAFAPAHDFTFEEFHVELEGDLDPDGFMGLADVRKAKIHALRGPWVRFPVVAQMTIAHPLRMCFCSEASISATDAGAARQ